MVNKKKLNPNSERLTSKNKTCVGCGHFFFFSIFFKGDSFWAKKKKGDSLIGDDDHEDVLNKVKCVSIRIIIKKILFYSISHEWAHATSTLKTQLVLFCLSSLVSSVFTTPKPHTLSLSMIIYMCHTHTSHNYYHHNDNDNDRGIN